MFSCMSGIEHDQIEYENGRTRGILWNNPLANKIGMVEDGLVGEHSNFKKNPTHTQDHGDA